MSNSLDFTFLSVVVRLALAVLGGSIIGYGRSKKERAAGLRTYILISIGACMSVLITFYEFEMFEGPWHDIAVEVGSKLDASRIAAQVITGIGFLGAGTIIKVSHQQVTGLTTATGMFATVCMGIAIGAGYYTLSITVMVLIEIILNVMSPMEIGFKRKLRNITLSVSFTGVDDIRVITEVIQAENAVIYDIDVERTEETAHHHPSAIFILQLSPQHQSHTGMLTSIAELPCVYSVRELIS